RDELVTGVQTCALPIFDLYPRRYRTLRRQGRSAVSGRVLIRQGGADAAGTTDFSVFSGLKGAASFDHPGTTLISGGMRWANAEEIGRASSREREDESGG